MNIGLNSSLNGEYTIYDENMVEIASTSNLITDWGMRRFLGDTSTGTPNCSSTDLPSKAFCYNFSNLFVGVSSTPVTTSDWKLGERVLPLSAETVLAQTGTSSKIASDGDLVIIYTHYQKLTFSENLPSSIIIREVGANWTNIESQDNRYGIFSRAVLPPTGNNSYVTLAANRSRKQVIFLRYQLFFKTNCNKVLTSMYHLTGTGATTFPANKTNVRRFPLYIMDSLARPVQELNNGLTNSIEEYVQPLFENMSLDNNDLVGTGAYERNDVNPNAWIGNITTQGDNLWWQSNLLGTATDARNARKVWWLQYYTQGVSYPAYSEYLIHGGINPQARYDNFYSTTTYKFNNAVNSLQAPRNYWVSSTVNAQSMFDQNANLNSNMGRVPHDYTELTRNGNSWNRKIQFFFTPNVLKPQTTVFKMYQSTLGNWNNAFHANGYYGSVYLDNDGYHDYGIVTALSAAYTPNPDHYIGFEYNFSFTRGLSSFSQSGNSIATSGFPAPQLYYDPNNNNSFNPTSTSLSATLLNVGTLSATPSLSGSITRADLGWSVTGTPNGQRVFNFDNTNFAINFLQAYDWGGGIAPITFNCWFSPQLATADTHRVIVSNTSGIRDTAPNTGFTLSLYEENSVLFYQRAIGGSATNSYQSGSLALHTINGVIDSSSLAKWYMLTFVYEPANKSCWVYVNGLRVTTFQTNQLSSFTAYTGTSPSPSNIWRIGGHPNRGATYAFRGHMGEFEVFLNYVPDPLTVYNEFENTKSRYGTV